VRPCDPSPVPKNDPPDELDSDRRREILMVLTSEHSNLQAARNAGILEANGRTTSFFAALSGALVALALIAQVQAMRDVLIPVAFVLAWTVLYIGLLTFFRLVQLTTMDALYVIGINRIRRHYIELVPSVERSRVLSSHDDLEGIIGDTGLTGRSGNRLDVLAAAPGMVGGIDGILAGFMAGLVAGQLGASPFASVAVGFGVGFATDAALFGYGLRSGVRFWNEHPPRYPTPER
jgi:hypothetical protein